MSQAIVAGAQVELYINGAPYAKVINFGFSVNTPKKEIRGLDSSDPAELAVTTQSVSGQMNIYKMSGDGGLEGALIAAPLGALSREKYFSLALVDVISSSVIFSANFCTVQNQSWNYQSKSLVTGSFSFVGITYTSEVGNGV